MCWDQGLASSKVIGHVNADSPENLQFEDPWLDIPSLSVKQRHLERSTIVLPIKQSGCIATIKTQKGSFMVEGFG